MEQKNFDRTRSREVMRLTFDSRSENEEFARVVVAVFATRMNPTLEEIDDIKTAVSEAVTNAVIHGYQNGEGTILIEAAVEEKPIPDRSSGSVLNIGSMAFSILLIPIPSSLTVTDSTFSSTDASIRIVPSLF